MKVFHAQLDEIKYNLKVCKVKKWEYVKIPHNHLKKSMGKVIGVETRYK